VRNRKSIIGDAAYSAFRIPHSAFKMWVATVLPRALRFKRPLHRCNACNPKETRREGGVEPPQSGL
jgi:hypothetical protein